MRSPKATLAWILTLACSGCAATEAGAPRREPVQQTAQREPAQRASEAPAGPDAGLLMRRLAAAADADETVTLRDFARIYTETTGVNLLVGPEVAATRLHLSSVSRALEAACAHGGCGTRGL
ncbi:MAG: hypothetical protein AB7N76_06545 [Planctomycetota bacterium]